LLHNYVEILDNVGLTLANVAAISRTIRVDSPDHRQAQCDTQSFIAQAAYDFWCYILFMSKGSKTFSLKFRKMEEEFDLLVKKLGSVLARAGYDLPQDILDDEQVETATRLPTPLDNQILLRGCGVGVTNQRRIFNAMDEVKPRDAIAAFQGTDRLFVLRPVMNSHRYRLVGDVYVDGLMPGEAYEGLDPQSVDYDIELI
jgi:hypothetical protein